MKKYRRTFSTAGIILLSLFLALTCIGGVELAVCSQTSPELYAQITAPIQTGFRSLAEVNDAIWNKLTVSANRVAEDAGQQFQEAASRLQNAWESLQAPPKEKGDIQLVDSEAVEPPPKIQSSHETTLVTREGKEYLTGGAHDLVYFNQTDDLWADQPYGSDHIGGYGCGPTVMAMVAATLADADTDPAQMARQCVDLGYWASKHGSYHTIVSGIAEEYGLSCESLSPDEVSQSEIFQCLSSGQLIVALLGPGHFTNSGHFIILRGVTLDGGILVADPASQERSMIVWDLPLILEELSSSREGGSPLWVISPKLL